MSQAKVRTRWLGLGALCAILAGGNPVAAEADGQPQLETTRVGGHSARGRASGGDSNTAKAHFDEGRRMFDARRYREAIHEFELARALWPSADLLFNIARAYEELGDYDAAVGYYRRYLRDAVEPADAQEVGNRIAVLERRQAQLVDHRARGTRVGALRLVSHERPARVLLDGRPRPRLAEGVQLFVSPGEYRLQVDWPGSIPFESCIQVRPGELTTAYPQRKILTPAHLTNQVSPPTLFWVGVGIAGVSFTTAAALGAVAALRRDENPRVSDRLAFASDIVLATSLATALLSAVVYFAEERG